MAVKPTYEKLEKKVKKLEKQVARFERVEKALKESQEKFRLLYERAPLAYQSLDEQGRLIEVNQAWLNMLGYARHEVIGRSVAEFLSPDWQDHFRQNFPRFKALGEVLGVEFELRTKAGAPVLITVNGKIGYDKDGNFQQTHCILYDITERDRADRIRTQIIAELKEKLAREKELVHICRNQVIADLQKRLAKEKEIENILADCETCREKLNR